MVAISMLEGAYVELIELGFPIQFRSSCRGKAFSKWSSRFSDARFSVSLFFALCGEPAHPRRRSRCRGKQISVTVIVALLNPPVLSGEHRFLHILNKSKYQECNIGAHPGCSTVVETEICEMKTTDPDVCAKASQESSGQEKIHLSETDSDTLDQLKTSVEFEVRSNVPGLKYTSEGRPGWTPIRVRRQSFAVKAADESSVEE